MILKTVMAAGLKANGFPARPEDVQTVWKAFVNLESNDHPEDVLSFLDDEKKITALLQLPYKKEVETEGHIIIDRARTIAELKGTEEMIQNITPGYIEITITCNGEYVDHDEYYIP